MWFITALLFSSALAKPTSAPYLLTQNRPFIIAHRGACGYIPEHTLQAYEVASYMSADFIESDLVPSKDFQLIVNHDNLLNETTNIDLLPQFSNLHTTKTIDTYKGNITETGWFIEDFSLNQIKELRAKQRLNFRPKHLNYLFQKITIEETLNWAINENLERIKKNKKLLGVYIELKYPKYFNSKGFPVQEMLLGVLNKFGVGDLNSASEKCPIVLECFELETLKYFSEVTDLPLVYLIDSRIGSNQIEEYSTIVHGVGPDLGYVFDLGLDGTGFIAKAHSNELFVHPWVMRDDILPEGANAEEMYLKLLYENADGIFTDFPDSASTYFSTE
ncbi:unnamed protein product [Blepharisma stoltei]|uniref:glycerophosphodiester phosphodiesterase n=1 Tax=Blepharisma stoltei TaxID=1481888 RepID=A0AAU9J142_9CILI|nr:unnamed protein product [Blepharisma stoltei]